MILLGHPVTRWRVSAASKRSRSILQCKVLFVFKMRLYFSGPRLHSVQQLLGGHLHDGRPPTPPSHLLQPQDDHEDQGLHLG